MGELQQQVSLWAQAHPLSSVEIDCAVAVMLKILDGKCKMVEQEKRVMSCLYDAVCSMSGVLLGDDVHMLIKSSRFSLNDAQKLAIYERRVLAETQISRPVMKRFKARIRSEGLFDCLAVP